MLADRDNGDIDLAKLRGGAEFRASRRIGSLMD
jgi:hypothetical protein